MTITERIDAITGIPDSHRCEAPPVPKSVKVELTSRCDQDCSFCARAIRTSPPGDMDKDLYKKLAKEMREAGVEELGLFYLGESFLVDWLPEAIEYAKEECGYPYVFLTTNGVAATPDRLVECYAAGLDSLKFSLNFSDEDQYKEIARAKKKFFHSATHNIRQAKRLRNLMSANCGIYASYIEFDDEQAEKMAARVEDLRDCFDEIYALPLYNQAAQVDNSDWKFVPGNVGRAANKRESLPCWSLFTEGHITHDGRLSACCFDHGGKFEVGNVVVNRFIDEWHSDKFKELRRAHLKKDVTGTVCEFCLQ